MSAAEGQSVAALTVTTLQLIHTDEMLDLFWVKVQKECEKIGVEETELPWARKEPKPYKIGLDDSPYLDSPIVLYCVA